MKCNDECLIILLLFFIFFRAVIFLAIDYIWLIKVIISTGKNATKEKNSVNARFIMALHWILQESSYEKVGKIAENCLKDLIRKYPYWNRTLGADHFFLTCVDDDVHIPKLVKNTIRIVCSSTYDSNNYGFIPHKDISFPSVMQPFYKPSRGSGIHKRYVFCLLLSLIHEMKCQNMQENTWFLGWCLQFRYEKDIGESVGSR